MAYHFDMLINSGVKCFLLQEVLLRCVTSLVQTLSAACIIQTHQFNHYHSMGKLSRRQIHDIFSLFFFQKIGFDISCKLSPEETIFMRCQSLFSEKNDKNISNCRLLKVLPSMLSF